MKICYLVSSINRGTGAGRYASDLIEGVRRAGHTAIVLTENGGEHPILSRGFKMLGASRSIRKFLTSCDIIHALDVNPFAITAWLAGIQKIPFVITALGTYSIAPFRHVTTKFLASATVHSADAVVAISSYTRDEFLQNVKPKRIEVINPGINLEKFFQIHEHTNSPYILSVGALKYRKGYHISIPAFAKVRKKIPDLRYVIVADQDDPSYMQELRCLIADHNLNGAVEFRSRIEEHELLNLYQRADLFVLAPVNEGFHVEGFGIVFLEAAASGVPVVGTLGNGICDAVSGNGILVPQGDIGLLADAMIRILSDKSIWLAMSEASHAWAKKHPIENVIKQYEELYKSL